MQIFQTHHIIIPSYNPFFKHTYEKQHRSLTQQPLWSDFLHLRSTTSFAIHLHLTHMKWNYIQHATQQFLYYVDRRVCKLRFLPEADIKIVGFCCYVQLTWLWKLEKTTWSVRNVCLKLILKIMAFCGTCNNYEKYGILLLRSTDMIIKT